MAGSGSLVVNVYTSRAIIPLQDASVSVTQDTVTGEVLLGFRYTDRNGHTEPLLIVTPDLEVSLHPSNETPYSLCNIFIAMPGYQSVKVRNVQVFPNVRAVQDVNMIPLMEGEAQGSCGYTVLITPQDL